MDVYFFLFFNLSKISQIITRGISKGNINGNAKEKNIIPPPKINAIINNPPPNNINIAKKDISIKAVPPIIEPQSPPKIFENPVSSCPFTTTDEFV